MSSRENHLYTEISESDQDWIITLVDMNPRLPSIREHLPFSRELEDFRNLSIMQLNQASRSKNAISLEVLIKMKRVIDFFYTLTGTRCDFRSRSGRWSVDDVEAFF
ncbi:MAG: hypothetical protein ACTSRG_11490 [Candidatus Helarchaeota archaeon]